MRRSLRSLFAAVLLLAGGHAVAGTAVQMQSPVPFAEDNDIEDNIKSECRIGEQLAEYVKQYAKVPVELTAQAPSGDRVLQLEIVDAVSMGNAFLGHQKFTKVKGTLFENGQKVASFKGRRNSMGGAFGGFKGSCAVLGRTVEVLGEDIGTWLASPVDGASLGD